MSWTAQSIFEPWNKIVPDSRNVMTLVLSVVHEDDSPIAEKDFQSALLLDKFARRGWPQSNKVA